MDFWEWLQRQLGRGSNQSQSLQLNWQGRGVSANVEDRRQISGSQNYGSFAQGKIGFIPGQSTPQSFQAAPPIQRNWNERLTSDMVRTPALPTNGSLKNAIWAVLSGEAERFTNEIHPDQFGGQNRPVVLEEVTVSPGPDLTQQQRALDSLGYLPQQRQPDWDSARAARVFNSTSAYGAGYYGNPQETVTYARDLLTKRGDEPRALDPELAASEDAWAMYLGLPQPFKNWQVSPYAPSQSTDPSTIYLRSPEIWHDLLTGELKPADWNPSEEQPKLSPPDGTVRRLLDLAGPSGRAVVSGGSLMDQEGRGSNGEFLTSTVPFALADFTITVGSDEKGPYISVYDIWDLDRIPGADKVGTPFEVYDRLYFDPRTFQPLWDEGQPRQRRRRFDQDR